MSGFCTPRVAGEEGSGFCTPRVAGEEGLLLHGESTESWLESDILRAALRLTA
jgi:hypothetical protein